MSKLNLGLLDDDFFREDKDLKQNEINFELNKEKESRNFIDASFENFNNNFNNQIQNESHNQFSQNKKPSGPSKKLFHNLGDFQFRDDLRIKIFGVGGAGNNMINHMAKHSSIDNETLYAINTDYQVLRQMPKDINLVMIGSQITQGHGSGSNPDIGRQAAIDDEAVIRELLQDTDLLFIVSGMGKGTGTGASPVIAEIAKEMGIMTLSLVNLPSISNEGPLIYNRGYDGLNNLMKYTSGILTISNEKLFNETSVNISLMEAFAYANSVISNVIFDLINLINVPSQINVDFNDVKTFFKEQTEFQVNTFEFRNQDNIEQTIISQLKDQIYQDQIKGGKKAIVNFKLNPNVTRDFINNLTQALIRITGNDNLEVTLAIDYFDNIEYAVVTTLISMDKNTAKNDQKEFTRPKTVQLAPETKDENEVEELEIINTSDLHLESKPTTIELSKKQSSENDNGMPNPFYNQTSKQPNVFSENDQLNVLKDLVDDFNSIKQEISSYNDQNNIVIEQQEQPTPSKPRTGLFSSTRRSFIPTRKFNAGEQINKKTIRFMSTSQKHF